MVSGINKIGKYEIVSTLGEGAMGIVYKGFDPNINRYVAIKTIRHNAPELEEQEIRERFVREAQAAGRLHHPNIVGIYEYAQDADRAFIVMEFVQGDSLAQHIGKHQRLTVEEVCDIMSKVLGALDYAHSMGVVHRDIKPENIMLTDNGEVKVTDFGIARIESSTLTRVGIVIGTPTYMSPEQLLGQPIDHRSDLFSAGILLFKLLTGERPFTGPNVTALAYNIVHSEHTRPSKLYPTLPGEFDDIVAKALAKRPEERFQTAKAFATALVQVANRKAPLVRTSPAENHQTVVRTQRSELGSGLGEFGHAPDAPTVISGSVQDVFESKTTGALDAAETASKKKLIVISGGVITTVLAVATIWFFIAQDKLRLWLAEPAPPSTFETPAGEESAALQQADRVKLGETLKDCVTCPEMVIIPPSSFTQGSPPSETEREENEGPQHLVRIEYSLAVGKHEITKAEFAQFVAETDYQATGCWVYDGQWNENGSLSWQAPGFDQDDRHPVTCVSWNDAQAYVQWLSKKTHQTYRLLSASEWEYVARARTQSARIWGDDLTSACDSANVADLSSEQHYTGWEVHNCWDEYVYTAPVGSFKPNNFGVYDMLGNVFEWVEDCWNDSYLGAPTEGSPWTEGDCEHRVLRGGSWFSMPRYVRPAFRNRFDPDYRSSSFGFRVASVLDQ